MKNKYLIAVLVGALLFLAACGGKSAATTPKPQAAVKDAPANLMLDPALAADAGSQKSLGYVYEGLARIEGDQPVAVLATDITPSADNLDYVVTLRPGVTFHDGAVLNADVVVTNFNRWFDLKDALHGSGAYTAWVTNFGGFKGEVNTDGKPKSTFDGIEKQNETTVILHLNRPDPDLLTKLSDPAFVIVSPAALKAAGFGTMKGKDGGTGPYKIGTWTDSGLTLDPFTSYWDPSAVPDKQLNIAFD
ncbi:MAG: ABC transporter substrate-binding protein [Anaerolineales bacterium]